MGVIFRNGIPYGGTESDVTTVGQRTDLDELTDKKENHLYIVEEDNLSYRYDLENEDFYALAPTIQADPNYILVGDNGNWCKENEAAIAVDFTYNKPTPSGWGNPTGKFVGTYYLNAFPDDDLPITFGQARHITGDLHPSIYNGFKVQGRATVSIAGQHSTTLDGGSIFEMHDYAKAFLEDNTEIRVYGDCKIVFTDNDVTIPATQTEPAVTYDAGITLFDGTNTVHFTIQELASLKSLLNQPRLAQMTQEEYDQLDPPDPNTVYVIGEEE